MANLGTSEMKRTSTRRREGGAVEGGEDFEFGLRDGRIG